MMKNKQQQRGISIIIVVFILVALSILAAAMVQVLTASSDSVAREVLSARAFMAAESGAQRMLNNISTGTKTACADSNNSAKNFSFTFSGFQGCAAVTGDCIYREIGAEIYYTVTSTGVCGPTDDEASRTIEVQAKNI
ncbi:hypothetical protein NO559_09755 [Dasania sp. GY-MA-18]|uniref:Type 4 fimbrial biogenesis protein PilX N-terminal domain-containing protein n=1 Tax=Dasania phycosphaerae TaxID=2950436 RepID=A0A9J6RMS1_9GAMM|nr:MULTISPECIES: hypothetical protein [Dasania]MCR8923056.1 hypothetical protein [Dasania sp. GY-MA-18]MCZ0865488.1 hypothetical protein [Dasania phycosphaerae]MCZ0869213.1 hypothetical protein [Dasania phycosphaerae]